MYRAAILSLALVFVAGPLAADQPPARDPEAQAGRDFLFRTPRATVSLRVSWLRPRADSDVFAFVSEHLTIEKDDFHTPAFIGEAGGSLSPRVDLVGGVEVSRSRVRSHYRNFVDDTRAEITQRTDLDLVNLSGSVKVNLIPRGQTVSRLAWVPHSFVPYLGAGAGMAWYRFTQAGDFVDFVDLDVFPATLQSKGWTPSAHVLGGADWRVWRALSLTVEARYLWAAADFGADFSGFEPIDLAGLRLSSGLSMLF